MKKSLLNYRAVGISFRRAATQILESLLNAPLAFYRGVEQAEKATVTKEYVLWGCPGLSFKANLPFDGMRPFFAALLKEIPTALFLHCFQTAKLLQFDLSTEENLDEFNPGHFSIPPMKPSIVGEQGIIAKTLSQIKALTS